MKINIKTMDKKFPYQTSFNTLAPQSLIKSLVALKKTYNYYEKILRTVCVICKLLAIA